MTDEAIPDAHELTEHGWLERRVEPSGDLSWWWTPAADAAFATSDLLRSAQGREN